MNRDGFDALAYLALQAELADLEERVEAATRAWVRAGIEEGEDIGPLWDRIWEIRAIHLGSIDPYFYWDTYYSGDDYVTPRPRRRSSYDDYVIREYW